MNEIKDSNEFLIINKSILPEVFSKVILAKNLLETKKCENISRATEIAGISRSVYYKYKDYVFNYEKEKKLEIFTLGITVLDNEGVLSKILRVIAKNSANILTINQTIPINNVANVVISGETNRKSKVIKIIDDIKKIEDVTNISVLGANF